MIHSSCLTLAFFAVCAAQAQDNSSIDVSKGNTLYVVPYAHLDTQWRWAYPQSIREYLFNTLERNFSLIEKYPHYVFNFSGSRRYEMMKEYYPADYLKLKGYIASGRWFPCGSSVDEGDANVPSGESIIRHVLYGNHYFRKEFGVASQEFMLPDCFGFPYALPSLLAHCGVKGFSTQKLTWGSAVGIPFKVGVWEGPDGKSVVAALDPGSYSADITEDLSQNTSWLARIQKTGQLSGAFVDYHYYGTGDTGGAPRPRAVEWVEKSIAGTGPIKVVSAKADDMFKALKPEQIEKLPRYKGELLLTQHSAGSISSEAYMKRWNRKSELLADAAEKSSVTAMLFGNTPYPSERLYNAWDLVLGSQMHDMLPGTSIPKAYEYCWNDFLLAQNQFASVETDAVGAVAKQMDTKTSGQPLVVFNPLSIARDDVVEANIQDPSNGGPITIVGPLGARSTAQVIGRNGNLVKIAFRAHVPSVGFSVFSVQRGIAKASTTSDLRVDPRHLENSRFKVTINEAGDIASIYDKSSKREVLKSPSRLEMQYENPGQYPAWNMDWDDAKLPPREIVSGPAKMRILEAGPTRVSIQVERQANGSRFVQNIRLSSQSERIEVLNNIDWSTRERALKVSFPLVSGNPLATYDLQLGTTQRGNNDPKKYEVPQHQWFDLSSPDGSYGAGILNDCKFGGDKPNDNTVRLTLIYTPGVRGGTEDQATQDFGRHQILYAIAPHAGDWRKGQVAWQAKRLNQPLRAFVTSSHSGNLGKSFSLVSSSSSDVDIQAIKRAEDSSEVIVRLREINGIGAKNVQIKFARPIEAARELDGQELPLGGATTSDHALTANLSPYSLKTYAVKLSSQAQGTGVTCVSIKLAFDSDVISTDSNPGDGNFALGHALAAEQLPTKLVADQISFALGSKVDSAKNAVSARGQQVHLPTGFNRVYILAAADRDTKGAFLIGTKTAVVNVQSWKGYVGQWDNRLFSVDPGPNFSNYGDTMNGLVPGYVKPGEVAWFASHNHTKAGNTFYEYSYLYKYGFDVPTGVTSVTLPTEPGIKILAMTVAKGSHDNCSAAQPLYDTLADHVAAGAPSISPAAGTYSDATEVKIGPPLYYRAGSMRYTLDGSQPTSSSPTYVGAFLVSNPTTVKVAQVDSHGNLGTVATTLIQVHDTTPPSIVKADGAHELGFVKVTFSEPVSADSAESLSNYQFASHATITSAKLQPDHRTVELLVEGANAVTQTDQITVTGVKDLSMAGNASHSTADVSGHGAIFTSPELEPKTARTFSQIKSMPIHGSDPWTLNLFCKIDNQPEDRTIIAGFGRSIDGRTGTGRYFTKFAQGINFWISSRDVRTSVPIDLGKWQMLTASYDGHTIRVYKNAELIGQQNVILENDNSQVRVMPLDAWERKRKFDGEVDKLTIWDTDLPAAAIKRLYESNKHP